MAKTPGSEHETISIDQRTRTRKDLRRLRPPNPVFVCVGDGEARPPHGARITVLGRYLGFAQPTQGREALRLDVGLGDTLDLGRTLTGLDAPAQTRFVPHAQGVFVRDLGSTRGVFLRVESARLSDGTQFQVGRQLFGFRDLQDARAALWTRPTRCLNRDLETSPDEPNAWGRIDRMRGAWSPSRSYPLVNRVVTLGRQMGDLRLEGDPSLSRVHCSLEKTPGGALLRDLGSTNGTFKRLSTEQSIAYGSVLLLGQTLVRVDAA